MERERDGDRERWREMERDEDRWREREMERERWRDRELSNTVHAFTSTSKVQRYRQCTGEGVRRQVLGASTEAVRVCPLGEA